MRTLFMTILILALATTVFAKIDLPKTCEKYYSVHAYGDSGKRRMSISICEFGIPEKGLWCVTSGKESGVSCVKIGPPTKSEQKKGKSKY